MTAVEEIQAAIEKLTKLRDESAIDVLEYDTGDATLYSELDPGVPLFVFRAHEDSIIPLTGEPDPDTFALAALIVTLHATIDAQLALLNNALLNGDGFDPAQEWPSWQYDVMSLARAINATS